MCTAVSANSQHLVLTFSTPTEHALCQRFAKLYLLLLNVPCVPTINYLEPLAAH